MRSGSHHSIYAPQKTPFDIIRLLGYIADQYVSYAKASGKTATKADVCPMQEMQASEVIPYAHVKIDFQDVRVLKLLSHFFKKNHVTADRVDNHLIINKDSLSATKMTSADEGDFCFQLKEKIQTWEADDMIQSVEPQVSKLSM